MWVNQCHKPAVTGNGKPTTFKNSDDWRMVQMALFYPHLYNGIFKHPMVTNMWLHIILKHGFEEGCLGGKGDGITKGQLWLVDGRLLGIL